MTILKYNGIEHVREVQRSDLGVNLDSDETLTWDKSNNFICPVELDDEEVQVLARSGGSWAIVEGQEEPTEEAPEPIELPTVKAPAPAPEAEVANGPGPVETQESAALDEGTIESQEGVDD